MSLPPHKCWPDFYQAIDIQDTSHEANATALPEPVQPEPVVGSTLSVEASVILMDNQPEVPETFPPKHEMTAKCARLTSGPALVVPCPTPVPVVPSPKRPPFTSVSRKVHEVSDTPLQMVLLTGEISIISLQCIMALNTSAAAVSLPKWLPFIAMAKGTQEVPAVSPSSIVSLREFPSSSLSQNMTQGISAPPSPTKDGPPQSLCYESPSHHSFFLSYQVTDGFLLM